MGKRQGLNQENIFELRIGAHARRRLSNNLPVVLIRVASLAGSAKVML